MSRNTLHAFNTCDDQVQPILDSVFCVLCCVVERLLYDHFDNGKFASPTAQLRAETATCPRENDSAERDFASLDRRLREKPNASTRCLEGRIMFANNDTAEWLVKKSPEEQARHIQAARPLKPDILATFQRRKLEIRKEQNRAFAEKKLAEAARVKKRTKEQEALAGTTILWVTAQ
eukprot:gene1533-2161_t